MDYKISTNSLGFKEITPKPSQDYLNKYYSGSYYQEGIGSYEKKYSQEELNFKENNFKRQYELIGSYFKDLNSPNMLDIGSGEGFAISFFHKKGFKVRGVDFSSYGVKQQNPDFQKFLEAGDIFSFLKKEVVNRKKFYDLILLNNILEHVIDPFSLMHDIKSLLSNEGLLLVSIPNDFSETQLTLLNLGHINKKFWLSPPDHLSYFNSKNFPKFADKLGYEKIDLISDFPIDWFLFHNGSNYIKDSSNGKGAHQARITIENMIHNSPVEKVVDFYRSAARLGIGRNLTYLLKQNNPK